MHRLILGLTEDDDLVSDHINNDRLDNRKMNLRSCTQKENKLNSSIRSNNTSGVTGVSYYTNNQKWVAELRKNGERKLYSSHDCIEDAIKARKEAEKKYFGEFRYDYNPNEGDDNQWD